MARQNVTEKTLFAMASLLRRRWPAAFVRGFRRGSNAFMGDPFIYRFVDWPGTRPLPHPRRFFGIGIVLERRIRSFTPGLQALAISLHERISEIPALSGHGKQSLLPPEEYASMKAYYPNGMKNRLMESSGAC